MCEVFRRIEPASREGQPSHDTGSLQLLVDSFGASVADREAPQLYISSTDAEAVLAMDSGRRVSCPCRGTQLCQPALLLLCIPHVEYKLADRIHAVNLSTERTPTSRFLWLPYSGPWPGQVGGRSSFHSENPRTGQLCSLVLKLREPALALALQRADDAELPGSFCVLILLWLRLGDSHLVSAVIW